MAGDLGLLPGRQLAVDLLQRLRRLGLQPGDLLADGDRVAFLLQRTQFLHLALQVGDRFLEIEVAAHQVSRKTDETVASAVHARPAKSGGKLTGALRPSQAITRPQGEAGRVRAARFRARPPPPGPSRASGWCSVDQRPQPLLQHVGVDLRGGDVGVAEELLDDAEIGAVLQQVAGEGMAHHVRRDLRRGNPGPRRQVLEIAGKSLPGQVAAVAEGGEQPRAVGNTGVRPRREIGGDRFARLVGQRHDALVAALAAHGEHALVATHHRSLERDQFGDPEAGGVEHLDQRPAGAAREGAPPRSPRPPPRPRACSISRVTWASLSTEGRRAGRRGPSMMPVGSSPRTPSLTRKRWNWRSAESRRAAEVAANPRTSRSSR